MYPPCMEPSAAGAAAESRLLGAIVRLVRTLTEVAPGARGLAPTVGRTPALADAMLKLSSAAAAAAPSTPVAATVLVETCSRSTRLLIARGDYIFFATLGCIASTRAEWVARRGL